VRGKLITYAVVAGSLLHDLLVKVVDEVVAVGADDLVGLLKGLIGGLAAHFEYRIQRELIKRFAWIGAWKKRDDQTFRLRSLI